MVHKLGLNFLAANTNREICFNVYKLSIYNSAVHQKYNASYLGYFKFPCSIFLIRKQ